VPLKQDIHVHFQRHVQPYVQDAWIDENKTKIGYEIPFNLYFYKHEEPRPIENIQSDIERAQRDILKLLSAANR
jgi:type I restriction enzyme M protein